MIEQQHTWEDRVPAWLDSLDPPLRTAAEAVVDEYLHPVRYEKIGNSDDWTPQAGVQYGISVNFDSEEVKLISEGLGRETNPIQLMHDMLLERAHAVRAERGDSDPDTVASAD